MYNVIAVFHITVALFLILLVLIQDSKGGGGIFGGGAGTQSVMGATGAASFLVKLTRGIAIVFASTCIIMTILATQQSKSVLDDVVVPPAAKQNAPNAAAGKPKKETPKSKDAEKKK